MEPFVLNDLSHFSIESWMKLFPELVAGITTKNGGFSEEGYHSFNLGFHVGDVQSAVRENRNKLSELLQFPLVNWVGAEQTHEIVLKKITRADCGKGSISYDDAFKGIDGFYTNEEGILLTLCFADCVPLFFISPNNHMIGVAHAGWKGTVNGIARQMVEAWKEEEITPNQIFIIIGPSICQKCYIVNEPVINLVENILEDVEEKPYNLIKEGQYSLDLREVNRQILIMAGVPKENIQITGLCSSCNEKEFFSHRRDKGKTGRMLSYIGWKEAVYHL